MAQGKLRIYYGPDEQAPIDAPAARLKPDESKVSLPLCEVIPLLADAIRSERAWLRDFENDEIVISADLHEVLLAHHRYRQTIA